jgi:hypothetical protein
LNPTGLADEDESPWPIGKVLFLRGGFIVMPWTAITSDDMMLRQRYRAALHCRDETYRRSHLHELVYHAIARPIQASRFRIQKKQRD